jgi:hypothetical protein
MGTANLLHSKEEEKEKKYIYILILYVLEED